MFENLPPIKMLISGLAHKGRRMMPLEPDKSRYYPTPPHWTAPIGGMPHQRDYRSSDARRFIGNLDNMEYEYWIGSPVPASQMAQCRVCGAFRYSSVARKMHFDEEGCATILRLGRERFNARGVKLCACGCAAVPLLARWGFVFNSEACIRKWKIDPEGMSPGLKGLLHDLYSQRKAAKDKTL